MISNELVIPQKLTLVDSEVFPPDGSKGHVKSAIVEKKEISPQDRLRGWIEEIGQESNIALEQYCLGKSIEEIERNKEKLKRILKDPSFGFNRKLEKIASQAESPDDSLFAELLESFKPIYEAMQSFFVNFRLLSQNKSQKLGFENYSKYLEYLALLEDGDERALLLGEEASQRFMETLGEKELNLNWFSQVAERLLRERNETREQLYRSFIERHVAVYEEEYEKHKAARRKLGFSVNPQPPCLFRVGVAGAGKTFSMLEDLPTALRDSSVPDGVSPDEFSRAIEVPAVIVDLDVLFPLVWKLLGQEGVLPFRGMSFEEENPQHIEAIYGETKHISEMLFESAAARKLPIEKHGTIRSRETFKNQLKMLKDFDYHITLRHFLCLWKVASLRRFRSVRAIPPEKHQKSGETYNTLLQVLINPGLFPLDEVEVFDNSSELQQLFSRRIINGVVLEQSERLEQLENKIKDHYLTKNQKRGTLV